MTRRFISIVIPTHNRRDSVHRTVSALLRQEYPCSAFEVIVTCDRCEDGTEESLRNAFGSRVRVLRSEAGTASARNAGLREARGELVVFLDDDMEPEPGFVSAHAQAHEAASSGPLVVGGYSPPVLTERSSPIQRWLARYYEDFFRQIELPARPPAPCDLAGGNFSISTSSLRELGGFDETYSTAREDFELAARLIHRGFGFRFCRSARAGMHILVTGDALVSRAEKRGRNDVRIARSYPWSIRHLPFGRVYSEASVRGRWRFLWHVSGIGAILLSAVRRLSPENLRLINLEYAARYMVGLRREAGSWRTFCRLAGGTSRT
jgi:GT2 family glycosyltransferase